MQSVGRALARGARRGRKAVSAAHSHVICQTCSMVCSLEYVKWRYRRVECFLLEIQRLHFSLSHCMMIIMSRRTWLYHVCQWQCCAKALHCS